MPSTIGYPEFSADRITAREECYARTERPSELPHAHKRVNSEVLVGMGAHFYSLRKTSWPRPQQLVIDETPLQITLYPTVQESTRYAQPHPRSVSLPSLSSCPPFPQRWQEEQSAISAYRVSQSHFIQKGPASESSDQVVSPSMSEDDSIPNVDAPKHDDRAPTHSSQPPTPPPASVATTRDSQSEIGNCPASPHPWSAYKSGYEGTHQHDANEDGDDTK
ncbi:hypothetical protein GQ44DRAFT_191749 [Phaeosphaeriaceae sp. PMI808]|nr:hypothetical protein GQ44DRAFT_191749 [Phaeosphaeriaceae sp. PMI808]